MHAGNSFERSVFFLFSFHDDIATSPAAFHQKLQQRRQLANAIINEMWRNRRKHKLNVWQERRFSIYLFKYEMH